MSDVKDHRMDNTYPDKQEIDDAIELFESLTHVFWSEQDKRSIEIGITALRYIKGSLYD